ncbi:MAG: YkgJ family cysteine cluster protein [Planctomycetaceae bacterium]
MGPCESCHAGCCRSFAVPLTGADVLRIERDFGLTFWDFACRWADDDGRIARRFAPQFHFRDEPRTPFVICLLHHASRNFPATTRCRFLVECPPDAEHPRGQARCGIHSSRPSACRAFPAKFDDSGLVVLQELPASDRDESTPVYDLCPRPWTPADVDPLDMAADLATANYEMAFFHQLAGLWNRSPGDWETFPAFLRLVYSRRVIAAPPAARRDVAEVPEEDDAPVILPLTTAGRQIGNRAA